MNYTVHIILLYTMIIFSGTATANTQCMKGWRNITEVSLKRDFAIAEVVITAAVIDRRRWRNGTCCAASCEYYVNTSIYHSMQVD